MNKSIFYEGPLHIADFKAKLSVTSTRADISCDYVLFNPSGKLLSAKAAVVKADIAWFTTRKPGDKRQPVIFRKTLKPDVFTKAEFPLKIAAFGREGVDLDYSVPVTGGLTKSFQFIPELQLDDRNVIKKVQNYEVEIELPAEARKLVSSSLTPSAVKEIKGRLTCYFRYTDTYLKPIMLKWLEADVDVQVEKTVKMRPGNVAEVSIRLKNRQKAAVKGLELLDDYSAAMVRVVPKQPHVKMVSWGEKDARVQHRLRVDLKAGEQKTITYMIELIGAKTQIPETVVLFGGDLVAVSLIPELIHIPVPFIEPSCAFAIPSGWSFDFLNGGDHHINEEGIWCGGHVYNRTRNRLTWNTSCIFADKNFDDDYKWGVYHQVARFSPGISFCEGTPWLAKTGNVSRHNGVFRHESLKNYSNAVVLIGGWQFDFTSGDHHINHIALEITGVSFNRGLGEIRWNTDVVYADKNFDDNYRYQYYYVILGFNGVIKYVSFNGTDDGGTALRADSVTDASLRGFSNAMVFPQGWSFDYASKDHHVNEHSFRIFNVAYNAGAGKVSWNTSLNYSDRNFDDDYHWRYRALIIATDFGEVAEVSAGPFIDDGGPDTKTFERYLATLFPPVTWNNGIQDGDETGVDCGGSSPAHNINIIGNVNPGTAGSSNLFSLRNANDQAVVRSFATLAMFEYADNLGRDFTAFYSGVNLPDRLIEAVAWYVDRHMAYVSDGGSFNGSQSAIRTLTQTGHRGSGDFNGDCEDHAILRATLLRSLGMSPKAVFCADHHNSRDQGQAEECHGDKKKSGGHTFNIVIYKGKYRILDYGPMQARYWSEKRAWDQHVVDNIWNDHTGKHWSQQNVNPFSSVSPMVNYPGNHISPSTNWDWRTYFDDVTL